MVLGPLSDKQPVLCPATSRAPSLAPPIPSVCLQGASPAGEKPLSESTLATWPCPAQTSSLPAMVWVPAPTRPLDPSSCMRDSRCRLLEDMFIALCPAGARVGPWDRHGVQGQLRGLLPIKRLDGHTSHPPVVLPSYSRSTAHEERDRDLQAGLHAVLACLCVQPQWAPLLFWGPGATRFGLQLPSSQELPPRRASTQAQARKPA